MINRPLPEFLETGVVSRLRQPLTQKAQYVPQTAAVMLGAETVRMRLFAEFFTGAVYGHRQVQVVGGW